MMKLKSVALALAVGDDQENHMTFAVNIGSKSFLIVYFSLKPVGRRSDRLDARKGLPIAKTTRNVIFDVKGVVRTRHEAMGRHHISKHSRA